MKKHKIIEGAAWGIRTPLCEMHIRLKIEPHNRLEKGRVFMFFSE